MAFASLDHYIDVDLLLTDAPSVNEHVQLSGHLRFAIEKRQTEINPTMVVESMAYSGSFSSIACKGFWYYSFLIHADQNMAEILKDAAVHAFH